jgi:hypothetical protein
MTTPNENEKNMCPNPQLVEVEKKEESMTEATQQDNKTLLSPIDRFLSTGQSPDHVCAT